MSKRRIWLKRITNAAASALALALITPAPAEAQDKLKESHQDDTESFQKELFTILPGLSASDTLEMLARLEKDPKTAKLVAVISDKLSAQNVKARDVEGDLVALIKGKKPEEAQLVLDAIIRDYYNHHVLGLTGNTAVQAVAQDLIKRDIVVSDAAFGRLTDHRDLRRVVRKKRRRI